jgi:hypothetical protein
MQSKASHQSRTVTLLEDCQSLVLKLLQPKIRKLFENSNVAFLEFAEKAQTGSSQIRFMEAMTIVQKDRTRIEDEFYREVGKSFTSFGVSKHPVSTKSRDDDLPLVLQSKEDADIEVAIQNMISSASLGATQTLGALLKRLAVLNHGRKIEECDLPGGPYCLAHAFHSTIRNMVLDHETRLIIYLLFDKFVLANTRLLFDEYNKLLVQAGILPNLKYEVHRNTASGASSHTQIPGTIAPAAVPEVQKHSLSDELFESVLQLISQRNNTNGGRPNVTIEPACPLPQQEVVTAIQHLQQRRQYDRNAPITFDPSQTPAERHTHVVTTMLQRISAEREQLFMGIDRRRLPSADTQVIDLVGMMFEYMLRDENLPSIAKAELCRLHTPYLKIAIVDKSLFTDTGHPAHQLLNALARAGTQWVFENNPDRGVFPCIRKIVQRIIEEFQNNLDIFTELLQFLNNNLLALEGKAAAIEERTRQAASGREKLEQARNCAAAVIESLVSGHHVPPELRKVLGDVWLDKLMFIYLREPGDCDSPSWKLATRAIETILWSIEPRITEDARNELINRLPEIRRQIEQALDMLSAYGTSDYKSQLSLIYSLQNKAVAQNSESGVALDPVDQSLQPSEVPVASGFIQPATAHTAEADIITDALPDEAQIILTPSEEAALNTLRQAAFGTWFTILMDPDQPPLQVKLSWYSGISGNYMFVNSMGVKALVIKHHELATLLASGKASITEQEQQPFIQRTLEMIRRMLGGVHKTGVA